MRHQNILKQFSRYNNIFFQSQLKDSQYKINAIFKAYYLTSLQSHISMRSSSLRLVHSILATDRAPLFYPVYMIKSFPDIPKSNIQRDIHFCNLYSINNFIVPKSVSLLGTCRHFAVIIRRVAHSREYFNRLQNIKIK